VKVTFDPEAWVEYRAWHREDAKVAERINALIEECRRDPFRGTGKPEPLGGNLSGWWSRRIGWEQRLVYRVAGAGGAQTLQVAQCRYHY
jgi:toxin YoeB